MNSNEFFVYTRNRPSKNKIINPMFRRY